MRNIAASYTQAAARCAFGKMLLWEFFWPTVIYTGVESRKPDTLTEPEACSSTT